MPYRADRGGHAPSSLRDAFCEWVTSESVNPRSLRRLTGQLWNCTDCLPGHLCDHLEIPRGSTYAVAARTLRDRLL